MQIPVLTNSINAPLTEVSKMEQMPSFYYIFISRPASGICVKFDLILF